MSSELATLREITEGELARIRKINGWISVYDVIRAVTGQLPRACRTIFERLTATYPEVGRLWPRRPPRR